MKRILLLILAAVMALALFGCKQAPQDTSQGKDTVADQKNTAPPEEEEPEDVVRLPAGVMLLGQDLGELSAQKAWKKLEDMTIRDMIRMGKVKPVCIDTNMEQLLGQAQTQNFVPVVDDRNVFIGIITRSDIIKYFVKKQLDAAQQMQ